MADIELAAKDVSIKWIAIKGAIALAVGLLVYLMPTPDNLTPEGHRLLALLVTIVILWVTEAVPIGVTALLAGAGLILFKVHSPPRPPGRRLPARRSCSCS